jgi:hypothetical protein
MTRLALFGVLVALLLNVMPVAYAADDTTLSGTMACAKCTLKKTDAKQCQNVLVVTDEGGKTSEYYIAKNDVSEKFGHVCKGEKPAIVTGQVEEKDGKMWITASKMEEKK